MVEVLVALVILSVGMLGTATLYVTSLQAKTTALSRMQAINLATDMADRIRANRNAPATSATTAAYAIAAGTSAATPVACVQTISTAAITCTPTQMATADLFSWSAAVTNALPGTVARSITVTPATATTPTIYVIFLQWTEPSVGTLNHTLQVRI